jgi:calcium-dependent protein kinase
VHRDLKPENFLLSEKGSNAVLKVTDFGLSSFFKEGEYFDDVVGSAYYLAPEVLNKRYSKEADIWSCGVMLYILLSGFPPFHGRNEHQIYDAIRKGKIDFHSSPWPRISDAAKDCVKRMLVRDPRYRATAEEILNHDWMRENGVASDEPMEPEVTKRINTFAEGNRFKKEALKQIVKHLDPEEVEGLKAMFKDIDKDGSGTISGEEFVAAVKKKGTKMSDDELWSIMQKMDVDGNGTIDYQEFVASMLNSAQLMRVEALKNAFDEFDADHNGTLDMEELRQVLAGVNIREVEDIMAEVDKNGDGEIDFSEFCDMFT